jgi:cytochrome c oxidase subunit 4
MNHALGIRACVGVWLALVALAAATFGASQFVHGSWEVVSAMSFAAVKAFLVAWFFMHLSRTGWSSRLAFLVAVLFVVLLVGFTLGDVMMRPELPIHAPDSE